MGMLRRMRMEIHTNTIVKLRFPGQYIDSELGTHYNYFRNYEASVGRYVTSDPIGLDGGQNRYVYVDNTPILIFDQYGLWSVTVPLFRGWGGSLTVGRTSGRWFFTGMGGVGLGVGATFDPDGEFNRSDAAACDDTFVGFGRRVSAGIGPVSASAQARAGISANMRGRNQNEARYLEEADAGISFRKWGFSLGGGLGITGSAA